MLERPPAAGRRDGSGFVAIAALGAGFATHSRGPGGPPRRM